MAFFDFFSTPAPTQQAAPTPAGTPGPAPTPGTPTNTDPFNPNHTTEPKTTATPTAPLAEFGELFKVDDTAPADADAPFAWTYDKATLEATVGNLSFVNPGQMAEVATSLGVQNPEALANFMNDFGRNLYMQSLLVNSKMSEQAVGIAEQRAGAKVPTHIRNSMVNSEIQSADANATDPALAPIVNMVSAQIAQKNPSFTPAQVAQHTASYMAAVAQTYAPKPTTTSNNLGNAQTNFNGFFKQG